MTAKPLPPGHTRPADTPETVEQMAERYGLPVELLNARVVYTAEPAVCPSTTREQVNGIDVTYSCVRVEPGHRWHVDASRRRSW